MRSSHHARVIIESEMTPIMDALEQLRTLTEGTAISDILQNILTRYALVVGNAEYPGVRSMLAAACDFGVVIERGELEKKLLDMQFNSADARERMEIENIHNKAASMYDDEAIEFIKQYISGKAAESI